MLIHNRKASFNYEFLEKLEAGIELLGHEVKTLREKKGSLEGAYIIVRGDEAYLVGAYIPPFQPKNTPEGYDPYQNRKLLLTKKEIPFNFVSSSLGLLSPSRKTSSAFLSPHSTR